MSESTPANPGLLRRLWAGRERVRTVRYGLNAYGKLPIYKDFISTGLTEPGARDFRNWLDRGFSHRWSVDDNYRQTEISSHSFLFRLPEGKGCVAGSLWGSSDEGGLRKFPFTLFVSFPAGQAAANPLTAVEYLSLLETRCQDLRDRFGPGASLASLYQAYRGAQFECPLKSHTQIEREARSSGSAVTLSEFAESLVGASSASDWPGFVADVAEAAAAASDGAGAVRIPLGGALPRAREIEFWLLWMARHEKKRRAPVCGILYPNGSGPGRATLFFRDLRPEDIFLFHPARTEGTDVREVPRVEAAAAASVVAPNPPEAVPVPAPEAPVSPVAATPVVSAQEIIANPEQAPDAEPSLEAPFLDAETLAPQDAPESMQVEPPLLDAGGRPRLTQAPFELDAPGAAAVSPVLPESLDVVIGTLAPPNEAASTTSEAAAAVGLLGEFATPHPVPLPPGEGVLKHDPPSKFPRPPEGGEGQGEGGGPEAVAVSAPATETAVRPTGWDRPVFDLLDV